MLRSNTEVHPDLIVIIIYTLKVWLSVLYFIALQNTDCLTRRALLVSPVI
ncbi:hypothetical protein [Actinopolymorpha pittospori]